MPIRFQEGRFHDLQGNELALAQAASFSDHARAHGINNTVPQALLELYAPKAVDLLRAIYEALGTSATVTSFYRCPILNSSVGGKIHPPSAHMDCRAVDSVPDGMSPDEAFERLRPLAHSLGFDQLIVEHDHLGHRWLHSAVARDGVSPRLMAFALEKGAITDRKAPG